MSIRAMGRNTGFQPPPELFLAAWVLLLVMGCGTGDQIIRNAERNTELIFQHEITSGNVPAKAYAGSEPVGLTFSEALCAALRSDADIRTLELALTRSAIDQEQARSMTKPRVSLNVSTEIPIGDGWDEADENLEAGLYVTYDIIKAVYADEALLAERLSWSRQALQLAARAHQTYHQLLGQLLAFDYRRREVTVRKEALADAQRALDLAQRLPRRAPGDDEALRRWKFKVIEAEAALLSTDAMVAKHHLQVHQLLHLAPSGDIGVKIGVEGWESRIPAAERLAEALQRPEAELKQAWERLPAIQLGKLDVLLAELGIAAAKRERFPRPWVALGLGNILNASGNSTVPLLPTFGLTMPIFDMGDAKRNVARAQGGRDLAQERYTDAIRDALEGYQEAWLALDSALKTSELAAKALDLARKSSQAVETLASAKRADSLAIHRAKSREAAARIAWLQSLHDSRRAYLDLAAILGEPDSRQIAALLKVPPPNARQGQALQVADCPCSAPTYP